MTAGRGGKIGLSLASLRRMSEVVSEDISCESNVEGQKSSLDDCKKVFHKPRSDEDEGDLKFDPPVYRQRYQVVGEMVKKYNAKKARRSPFNSYVCIRGQLVYLVCGYISE